MPQNVAPKNENGAQKSACFYFFRSIFWKSKYMEHNFSILTDRKSKNALMRHNSVAGNNFSGKSAVSKISYWVLWKRQIHWSTGFLQIYRVFQNKVPTFVLLISRLQKHLENWFCKFSAAGLCRIQKIKTGKAIGKHVMRIHSLL